MADEGQFIRGIYWRQVFPVTHIFRTFRIAIHPSKLVLGLALLISVYLGGRVLDAIWPIRNSALPGEVQQYQAITEGRGGESLNEWRTAELRRTDQLYAGELLAANVVTNQSDADAAAKHRLYLGQLKANALQQRDAALQALTAAKSSYTSAQYRQLVTQLFDAAEARLHDLNDYHNRGLFATLIDYEISQVTGVAYGALEANWFGPSRSEDVSPDVTRQGVVPSILNFVLVGPVWLIGYHTFYFVLFATWVLIVWSLFGGAISRIAAVHVARDEKISLRQALNFSAGKFLSFASAPLIPLMIVLVVGLFLTVSSLVLGNIPYIGPIIVGGLFFLALLAGFVMTLVLLGTAGGFNLMYPTVAVEGSDSFDAISRSFSYVYARPWRMLFYTVVAIIYGAACYLFIHMFLWLMLVLAHVFTELGIFVHADSGRDLLSAMWPSPAATGRLAFHVQASQLNWGQWTGAWLLAFWVYLVVGLLGAFALSFYFSVNTIIYFLMRNEVDATELDDVYLEQSDEDFGEPAPAGPAAPTGGAAVTSAAPASTPEAAGVAAPAVGNPAP